MNGISTELSLRSELQNLRVEPSMAGLVRERIVQPMSAIQVDNEVDYVNPDLQSPRITFKKGEPTELGVQVAMGGAKKAPDRLVYARPGHNRSIIITNNADIRSSDEQKFAYLDAKGTGNLSYEERDIRSTGDKKYAGYMKAVKGKPDKRHEEKSWGFATARWIKIEKQNGKLLQEIGVRTTPVVATSKINELISPEGKTISINEAIKRGYLSSKTKPEIAFRAWVTPFRMTEITYTPELDERWDMIGPTKKEKQRKRAILNRAMLDMKEDPTIPQDVRDSFPNVDVYLRWVAQTVGSSLGKMHSKGVTHGYLRALHNTTLDGRFVDLDDMTENSSRERIKKERLGVFDPREPFASYFLSGVPKLFGSDIDPGQLLADAKRGYEVELSKEK